MTRVVSVHDDTIRDAAALIRQGGLVAYPTDTVYGLGCDPFNADAVERLVKSKGRNKGSLPVLVESTDIARQLGTFSDLAVHLAEKFWPGPLTIVVSLKASLPADVTGDFETIGLRIPNHPVACKLIKSCDGAIIGTSANLSGKPSSKTADQVMRELKGRIDLIIDGGPALSGKESTVAKVVDDRVSVLREGAIPRGEILKAIEAIATH